MMQFCNLFTRSRSCLVGLAVFCFSFAPVCVNAATGDNPVEAAWTVPLPWPGSQWSIGEFLYYQLGNPTDTPSVRSLLELLADSSSDSASDLSRISDFLRSVSNQLDKTDVQFDKTEIGSYANTVDTWLQDIATALYDEQSGTPLLNKIRNLTYTEDRELRVHDKEAVKSLSSLESLLSSFYGTFQDHGSSLSTTISEIGQSVDGQTSQITQAIEEQTGRIIDYLDEDPTDTEDSAKQDVDRSDQDAEDSLLDTSDDYEYEVPQLDEPEEPSTDTPTDSSGVGDISPNVQHSALITLTRGNNSHTSSSPFLPRMEIDLMSTPGAADFISQLSALIRYGWDAVFAFLGFCLYYSTFRRIRNMLIATRAGGVPSGEPFSLSYDPF